MSLETESDELLDTLDAEVDESAELGLTSGDEDADSSALVDLVCSSYLLKAKSFSSGLLLAIAGLTSCFLALASICSMFGFLIHHTDISSLKDPYHTRVVPDKVRPGDVQIHIMVASREF